MPTCPPTSCSQSPRPVVSRSLIPAAAALFLTAGCASPGPPRPPSLHLPQKATNLSAERVGNQVRVSWTTPEKTTDRERIRFFVTAVLCRTAPPSRKCTPVSSTQVWPGAASATDTLPPELAEGPIRPLEYHVELLNRNSRSAGLSNPVLTAAGAAPQPVGPIRLVPRRGEVLVLWQPVPDASGASFAPIHLQRTLTSTPPQPASPRPQSAPAKEPQTEVTLREPASDHRDPGGLSDRTVADGASYTYVAQRVLELPINGQQVTLRSLASPPASIAFHDVFPPAAPTGLVAAPGGGFGRALSIDLSWEPSPEPDVVGYNVFRRTGTAAFTRLTATPVPAPAFRDLDVQPGSSYTYRVTAVDAHGNESAPGTPLTESPRQ